MKRRDFLQGALVARFALTPIAALLSACSHASGWPENMEPIAWDRDACTRCRMVISDRRFAVEVQGGPKAEHYKFDDVGCATFWLKEQAWGNEAATRLWVADSAGKGERWLDARRAQYVGGRSSPMGYDFAAVAQPEGGSLGFDDMRQHVLARGR